MADLQKAILNLPCVLPDNIIEGMAYKQGHRDARHAAAELVAAAEADGAEPVTEEWLKDIGFEGIRTNLVYINSQSAGPVFRIRLDLDMGCDGCCIVSSSASVDVHMPETRVEVKRLCSALGITLKEPTHAG